MIDLKYLNEQKASFEKDLETLKVQAVKITGALELTRHLIQDLEQDEKDGKIDPPPVLDAVLEE